MTTQHTPFDQILHNAGYHESESFDIGANSSLWRAILRGPVRDFEENFLFLDSECDFEELITSREELKRRTTLNDLTVVFRNSSRHLRGDAKRLRGLLGVRRALPVNDFLANTVRRIIGSPAELGSDPSDYGLRYFVEPGILFPGTNDATQAIKTISTWLLSPPDDGPNVAVLLAPAGMGKSTVASELFRNLRENLDQRILPLLVNREQWLPFAQREELSLRQIWALALAEWYPEAIVGAEPLGVLLKNGAVCPVFDGLDEICSYFPTDFTPSKTVEQLVESFTDGRCLLTSRNLFWEENVDPAIKNRVLEVELFPFSREQRRTYIDKRFPQDTDSRERAEQILSRLSNKVLTTAHRAGAQAPLDLVPYVVMLAAESASLTQSILEKYGYLLDSDDPLWGLLLGFCYRERPKQRLTADPEEQLKIFQLLAIDFPGGFTDEHLAIAVAVAAPDRGADEAARLANHDFLRPRSPKSRVLEFRFDFVGEYLIARAVRDWWFQSGRLRDGERALILCEGSGGIADRCVDLLMPRLDESWEEAARALWADLDPSSNAAGGMIHVVLRLAKERSGGLREGATSSLLRILGNWREKRLMGLTFRGFIQGYDFRQVTFEGCRFEDVEFVGCRFGEDTTFSGCRFEGVLRFTSTEGLRWASWLENSYSVPAYSVLQNEIRQPVKFPFKENQVREWLLNVLRRFRRGAMAFVTRKQDGVRGSLGSVTPHADLIFKELIANEVLLEFASGSNKMFKVQDTHAVRVFLDNGTMVAGVKAAYDRLRAKIVGHH